MIQSDSKPPSHGGELLSAWSAGFRALKRLTHPAQERALHWRRAAAAWQPQAGEVKAAAQAALRLALRRTARLPLRALPAQVWRWLRSGSGDGPLLQRYALHLVVICLAAGVIVAGHITLPQADALIPVPTLGADVGGVITGTQQPSFRGLLRASEEAAGLQAVPVVHTIIPERPRTDVITYTVQVNDNLWLIAQDFGLKVETMLWANPSYEQDPSLLAVGQVLVVPPVDGVYYTVRKGDTLAKLVKTYKTSIATVAGWQANHLLQPYDLVVGQKILLVGGQKPQPSPTVIYPLARVASAPRGAPKGTGKFAWPTRGVLTQHFWSKHTGIDIANRIGTPVVAADDGYVVLAGTDTWGYGVQIVVDHGNGFWTRYAHLSKLYVTAGDVVKKNQRIGDMGSTGHSTGPHLHFEVIKDKTCRNPLTYLP